MDEAATLSESPTELAEPVCRIAIRPEFGWRSFDRGNIELWTKGYGRFADGQSLLNELLKIPAVPTANDVAALLASCDGHFALAARGPGWAFAAVDHVRSIPIAFARCGDGWCIGDQALRLRNRACLGQSGIDASAARA
ncbi:MAG TPA: hypothetical protein VFG44_01030, partial [Burkholderiales bacterium]|nr:hypothetical protein [Burkholderiales bacterium]